MQPFSYVNKDGQTYFLHKTQANLRSGKVQTIYYFSKVVVADRACVLPDGFEVVENKKTGLPVLRRVKNRG